MTVVASREAAHAWELRGAWARGLEIVVTFETSTGPGRVQGEVVGVAVTNAFVLVAPAGAGALHVPCAAILAVRRPHFSEPLDFQPELSPVEGQDGQLRLWTW